MISYQREIRWFKRKNNRRPLIPIQDIFLKKKLSKEHYRKFMYEQSAIEGLIDVLQQ